MKQYCRPLLFLFIILCSGVSLCAYAGEYDPLAPTQLFPPQLARSGQWMVGVGGGADDVFFHGRTNTLLNNVDGNPADTFKDPRFARTGGIAQIFAGYRWPIAQEQYLSLQLEYDYAAKTEIDGLRTPLGGATAYEYNYYLRRHALLLLAKMDLLNWHALMPYIQLGGGISRNTFLGFNDDKVPPSFLMPDFPDTSRYNACAVVGIGADWAITRHFLLSAGYRLGYWGEMTSGTVTQTSAGAALPSPIKLQHTLYSNQYLVSLSYLF